MGSTSLLVIWLMIAGGALVGAATWLVKEIRAARMQAVPAADLRESIGALRREHTSTRIVEPTTEIKSMGQRNAENSARLPDGPRQPLGQSSIPPFSTLDGKSERPYEGDYDDETKDWAV